MPTPYLLRQIDGVRFEPPFRGEFTDDEWATVSEYLEETERLGRTRLVSAEDPGATRFEWSRSAGWTVTGLPSASDLSDLVHNLRPFVLQEERTYFFKLTKLIFKHESHAAVRAYLKEIGRRFRGELLREELRLVVGKVPEGGANPLELLASGTVLNSEKNLSRWLNGYEYHRDQEDRRHLEDLCAGMPFDVARGAFVMVLQAQTQAIFALARTFRVITAAEVP